MVWNEQRVAQMLSWISFIVGEIDDGAARVPWSRRSRDPLSRAGDWYE
jgi:hypothetical protein